MGELARWGAGAASQRRRTARRGPAVTLSGLGTAFVTLIMLAAAAVLAVVFAATLAVVMLLATALFGLTLLALKARPTREPVRVRARTSPPSWVAYRWDSKRD